MKYQRKKEEIVDAIRITAGRFELQIPSSGTMDGYYKSVAGAVGDYLVTFSNSNQTVIPRIDFERDFKPVDKVVKEEWIIEYNARSRGHWAPSTVYSDRYSSKESAKEVIRRTAAVFLGSKYRIRRIS